MQTLKMAINKIEHAIYMWGDPSLPPLFLLHGWMDSARNFQFLCEHLQKSFYCIAPDLRGHGQSGHTENPLGYFFFEYLADVEQIFHHFSPKGKIMAIGHSMGGNILSLYAGAFPDRVGHFINVEGLGIEDMPSASGPQRLKEWILSIKSLRMRKYKTAQDYISNLKKRYPLIPDDRLVIIAQSLIKQNGEEWILMADAKHTLIGPHLYQLQNMIPFWQSIQAKVLFVEGEHTEMGKWMGNRDAEKEIAERLSYFPKDTKRILIKDCGHMIHYERPEILAEKCLAFLK